METDTGKRQRFCSVHGWYDPEPGETRCPDCLADPDAAQRSFNQIRLVPVADRIQQATTHDLSVISTAISDPDPVDDEQPCPMCDQPTRLEDFRHEVLGERWQGEAAIWAEEGVCPDCYAGPLAPFIRRWTDAEWVSHDFEGWRNSVLSVGDLLVFDDDAEELWMDDTERHQVLNVDATVAARHEHLVRSEARAQEIAELHAGSTLPDFDRVLAAARAAISDEVIAELRARRLREQDEARQRRVASRRLSAPEVDGERLAPEDWGEDDSVVGRLRQGASTVVTRLPTSPDRRGLVAAIVVAAIVLIALAALYLR